VNVTFSATIWPEIIQKYCLGCHSGSNPGGGIPLENYDDIAAVASDGRLLGVITHSAGYSPMPKNAPKLSDCKISQVTKWINDGIQNN
jgi:mono/diheme cytochrome c family protein